MKSEFKFVSQVKEGVCLTVKLVPNSSFNKIVDYTEEFIRIKIAARPIENKANNELINFCSDIFGVSKSKISVISGEKSKLKRILFKSSNCDLIIQKLMFVLDSCQKENNKG